MKGDGASVAPRSNKAAAQPTRSARVAPGIAHAAFGDVQSAQLGSSGGGSWDPPHTGQWQQIIAS